MCVSPESRVRKIEFEIALRRGGGTEVGTHSGDAIEDVPPHPAGAFCSAKLARGLRVRCYSQERQRRARRWGDAILN